MQCYRRNANRNYSIITFRMTVLGGGGETASLDNSKLSSPNKRYGSRRRFRNSPFLPNNLSFDELFFCNTVRLVKTNSSWTALYEGLGRTGSRWWSRVGGDGDENQHPELHPARALLSVTHLAHPGQTSRFCFGLNKKEQ